MKRTRSVSMKPGGRATCTRREPCEVCTFPKVPGNPLLVWSPTGEDRDLYKKVFVHPACRGRLLAGERPAGVMRLGPSLKQLHEIVVLCENQLGVISWDAHNQVGRPLRQSEMRRLRMSDVYKMELVTEGAPELLSYRNLRRVVDYLQRTHDNVQGRPIREPFDLVVKLRELAAAKRLDRLVPPAPDWDLVPF